MKIEIDISDFWIDDESQLEPALKTHIINECVYKIKESIKEQVATLMDNEIKKQIREQLDTLIAETVKSIIETETVRGNYGKEPVTLKEYVIGQFQHSNYTKEVDKNIETIAKGHGDQMKKRYDLLFASQLVSKMHENGLLKEDVAKLLLPQS